MLRTILNIQLTSIFDSELCLVMSSWMEVIDLDVRTSLPFCGARLRVNTYRACSQNVECWVIYFDYCCFLVCHSWRYLCVGVR